MLDTPRDSMEDESPINPLFIYFREVDGFSLLKNESEETNLSRKIFNAKLSLRALRDIKDYLSINEQNKINNVISEGRGRYMLTVFSSEITERNKTIQEKEDVGEEAPKEIVDFIDDASCGELLTGQKIENLLSIKNEEIRKRRILEFTEEQIASFSQGSEAVDILCNSNLKLPITIARKYNPLKLSRNDLIQFGNLGLYRAAVGFDDRFGLKFSTSAVLWIRQTVSKGIKKNDWSIRVPLHVADVLSILEKKRQKMEQEEGRYVSPLEAAKKEFEFDLGFIKPALDSRKSISLDITVDDGNAEESETIVDFVADKNTNVADEAIEKVYNVQIKAQIENALMTLEKDEKELLETYFGIRGVKGLSLAKTGEKLGIKTREGVRQHKKKSLSKLEPLLSEFKSE